jgi:hypothetical protein
VLARLNAKGQNPLLEACAHNSKDCASLILRKADIDCSAAGEEGWSAVHYAAKWGDEVFLKAVLTHPSFKRGQKTSDERSAEVIAKAAGNWKGKVKELLKRYDSIAGMVTQSDDEMTFSQSAALYVSLR